MRPPRVRLTIDRVVLRGLERDQRHAFVRGLREALVQQLSDAQLLGELRSSHRAAAVAKPIAVNAPADLGTRAAQAVVASLRGRR